MTVAILFAVLAVGHPTNREFYHQISVITLFLGPICSFFIFKLTKK